MPPEAFEPSYEPVRAFDRYRLTHKKVYLSTGMLILIKPLTVWSFSVSISYGILLWSIVTGKEPYPGMWALFYCPTIFQPILFLVSTVYLKYFIQWVHILSSFILVCVISSVLFISYSNCTTKPSTVNTVYAQFAHTVCTHTHLYLHCMLWHMSSLYHIAADYSLVALKIPMGDRPHCEEIDLTKTAGLNELVDLMKRCWGKNPVNRPTFKRRFIL